MMLLPAVPVTVAPHCGLAALAASTRLAGSVSVKARPGCEMVLGLFTVKVSVELVPALMVVGVNAFVSVVVTTVKEALTPLVSTLADAPLTLALVLV